MTGRGNTRADESHPNTDYVTFDIIHKGTEILPGIHEIGDRLQTDKFSFEAQYEAKNRNLRPKFGQIWIIAPVFACIQVEETDPASRHLPISKETIRNTRN